MTPIFLGSMGDFTLLAVITLRPSGANSWIAIAVGLQRPKINALKKGLDVCIMSLQS